MPNTYHQIYLQTVFAVKYRNAILEESWKSSVFGVIGNLINECDCKTIIVNGMNDHVHCVLGLRPRVQISELLKNVKARSSKYINDNSLTSKHFEWQEGYGAFSYSHAELSRLYEYVRNQESHHKMKSFMEEYLGLLKEFDVEYDERYLFKDLQ